MYKQYENLCDTIVSPLACLIDQGKLCPTVRQNTYTIYIQLVIRLRLPLTCIADVSMEEISIVLLAATKT